MNPYNYSFNNPVMWSDPSGADPGDTESIPPLVAAPKKEAAVDLYGTISRTDGMIKMSDGSIQLPEVEIRRDKYKDQGPGEYHFKMTMNAEGNANFELVSFRNVTHHRFWFDTPILSKRYIVDFDFLEEGNKRYYIGFPQEGKGYANAWKAEDFENDYLKNSGDPIKFIQNYATENGSYAASTAYYAINAQNTMMEAAIPMGAPETYYRSMSTVDYEKFKITKRIPATSETFISPTQTFSESYEGVLVEFQVKPGTTDALKKIGVRAHGTKSTELLPDLPLVKRNLGNSKALFKPEGSQINIGLGKGKL